MNAPEKPRPLVIIIAGIILALLLSVTGLLWYAGTLEDAVAQHSSRAAQRASEISLLQNELNQTRAALQHNADSMDVVHLILQATEEKRDRNYQLYRHAVAASQHQPVTVITITGDTSRTTVQEICAPIIATADSVLAASDSVQEVLHSEISLKDSRISLLVKSDSLHQQQYLQAALMAGDFSKALKKQKRRTFWSNLGNTLLSAGAGFGAGYLTGKLLK